MGLMGDLEYLALVDIIQINCLGRSTARLTVHYPIGDGIFYFADGEVVDARLGNLVGIDAVYKALEYNQGSFRLETGVQATTRTIFDSWANLIMEGLRLLDEANAAKEREAAESPAAPSGALPTPATTSGMSRVFNVYHMLVGDLTRIKGVDAAIAIERDGTINANAKFKSSEKAAMSAALLSHLAGMASQPGRSGKSQRITMTCGQRKFFILDQTTYLTVIECAASMRFETISPLVERAFRKVTARVNTVGGAFTENPLSDTGPRTLL